MQNLRTASLMNDADPAVLCSPNDDVIVVEHGEEGSG